MSNSFSRTMAESELQLTPDEETDEFIQGVIGGFHKQGQDCFRKDPLTTASHLCWMGARRTNEKWAEGWNDAQCLEYIRGFVAGYHVRQISWEERMKKKKQFELEQREDEDE